MKNVFLLLFILLVSPELMAGVSIRLKGKIVSYTDSSIKMMSEGKLEVIPMEYVSPVLKNELYKWVDKEIIIRLPEHVLKTPEK